MKEITIDIETKSDKDLTKCGVYAYAESEHFDILLFAYSVDGGDVIVIDIACGEKIPEDILAALTDENIIKQAFNVNFERICLSAYIRKHYPEYFKGYGDADDTVGNYLNPKNWQCTMIHSRYLGLPSSLAQVGEVLKIKDEKMAEGKALIRYFCVPFTETEGVPQFHQPNESPEKWKLFKTYNKRDVEAEMEIDRKLEKFPVPDFVWEEFYTDQMINDRGIAVDMKLAMSAIRIDENVSEKLSREMCRLTGVENPNSVYQLLDWLETQGYKSDSLGKKEVQELIKTAEEPVRSVLAMRLQLSKSSVRKYLAMEQAVCRDSRVRGMFSFYGASRTGRHCSKIIQLQNLPQNHLLDLSEARALVKSGDAEMISLLYNDIPDTLSQLIRTAFVPREGYKFIVSDYSAIEARVIAWLAGEDWRMEAFAKGEDIYCASASKMFGVPVVKHGENGHLRQKGKVAELACIAEGQLVLTDHGLIPIEKVSVSDRVWDGMGWIKHEGIIYKGEQKVITYDGLTATPDHFVWIKGRITPVPFGVAAATGSCLVNTGNDRIALQYSWKDHIFSSNEKTREEQFLNKRKSHVYDLKNAGPNHRFTVSGKLVHNCGYGGSVGAMKAMGADSLGLSDTELKQIVTDWREASPNITDLWWAVDRAAKKAVKEKTTTETHGLKFSYESGFLFIELPSGRRLAYAKP
ncbi:MAG: DNA polymerase, partial [Ruminococcus sp.]